MNDTRTEPLVSVVIPTHDRAPVLPRALGSVLNQTLQNFEVIIVDDGSRDDTFALIPMFSDPRVQWHRLPEREGAAAARNVGIRSAAGRYISFLDSDDEYHPEYLERLTRFLEASPQHIVAVVCSATVRDKHGAVSLASQSGALDHGKLLRFQQSVTTTCLMARSVVLSNFSFDPALPAYQEWDLLLRMTREYRIPCLPDVLAVLHDLGRGSKITKPANHISALTYLLDKHAQALATDPLAQRQWHLKLLRLYMKCDNLKQARWHARQASLAYPRRLSGWLLYLPSMAGDRIFRQAWSLYRKRSTARRARQHTTNS